MSRSIRHSLFLLIFPVLFAQDPSQDFKPGSQPITVIRRAAVSEGIAVELQVHQADFARVSKPFSEGDPVRFTFRITDEATGRPVSNAYPAGWLAARLPSDNADPDICVKKAKTLISGNVFSKAELDLNVYFVVTLNDDNTLSVVDPLFGFGTTKLLALIQLPGRGHDWVLDNDQEHIYISIPETGELAVVETRTWKLIDAIDIGNRPGRTVIQPDGHFIWVAEDGGEEPGVVAIDAGTREIAARIPTGPGNHDLAIDPASRYLWVTNRDEGTTSVVDIHTLARIAHLETGEAPVSIAVSGHARIAAVAHEGDGRVTVIDGTEHRIITRIPLEPGLSHISFAPGERFGFIANPVENTIHVLDTVANIIVQTGDMENQPDQITYSDDLAYVRQRGAATVWMVPLDQVGVEGAALQVVDFPGGQNPPGKMRYPTPAAGMVQATGASAMLVANPGDQSVYFYKEGMAAPMGNFNNYGRRPRAVLVVDRSLRERAPGIYQTHANLPAAGDYDMVFFMDSPRLVLCFDLTIDPDPVLEAERKAAIHIVRGGLQEEARVGTPVTVSFKVLQHEQPVEAEDVAVMVYLTPGVWHERGRATARGDGVYTYDFTPPRTGIYYASLAAPSLGIDFNNPYYGVIRVRPETIDGNNE